MPNPKEISQKKFEKALGFGYRMDDVDGYLQNVAAEMQELLEEKADLEKKLEILADKLTEYREDEESLRTAILSAQKLGDNVIRESKTKAEIIMRDATIKADAMIQNARRQIERENDSLKKLQREVANFKNRLIALYRQHLELVTALPGEIEGEENPEKPEKQAEPEQSHGAGSDEEIVKQEQRQEEKREEINKAPEAPCDDDLDDEAFPPQKAPVDEEFRSSGVASPLGFSQSITEDTIEFNGDRAETPEDRKPIKRFIVGDDDLPEMPINEDEAEGNMKSSLKSMFDEDDLDNDEPDLSFFNKANTPAPQKQERDLRFGESFKIKRDKSFPRFR